LGEGVMFRRWVLLVGVVAMGLALNGCTKCGPIWDDWVQSPKSRSVLTPLGNAVKAG